MSDHSEKIFQTLESTNEILSTFASMFPEMTKQVSELHTSINRIQPKIDLLEAKFNSMEPVGKESIATRLHVLDKWKEEQELKTRELSSMKLAIVLSILGNIGSFIAIFKK